MKKWLRVLTVATAIGGLLGAGVVEQASAATTYYFYNSSFSNYVYLKGGAYFTNPSSINIETMDRNPIRIDLVNSSGGVSASCTMRFEILWDSCNWGYTSYPGSYKVRLVNLGSSTADIKQGDLTYN